MKAFFSPSGLMTYTPARLAWLRARPFALAAVIAIVLLPAIGTVQWGQVAVAAGLTVLFALAVLLTPAGRPWAGPDARAIVALLVLAILRNSVGGAAGGYGGLAVLPVLWVALYGNSRQLARTLFAVALSLVVPLIVIGAPHYPLSGWRSGPLLLLTCAFVGLIVQELLSREREHAAERAGLLAAIGDGVIVTDALGHVLEVNRALCTLTGYDAQEIVGTTAPLPSWPVEDHGSLMRSHAAAIAAGGGAIEARLVRKDGREIFVTIVLAVAVSARGRTVVATVKDTTEQVHLREQLRGERDRSQTIIASMHEGFGLTRDGELVEVNAALCRITGFTREQLVGSRMPYPYWPPELAAELLKRRGRLDRESGGTFETQLVRADGARFDGEITTALVYEPDGEVAGSVSTVRDVTDRKRAEEDALARSEQLARLASITRAVAHAEPSQAGRTVCEMAIRVGAANVATIWEPDEQNVLHITAMLGAPTPNFTLGPDATTSGARQAFDSGRAVFANTAKRETSMEPRMRALVGCGAAHFQPIVDGERVLGVIAMAWTLPLVELGPSSLALVELLAHEASVAIGKAAAHAQLESMARTDILTGLPNRRALEELFPRAIALAGRTGQALTVAMLDLDHFKAFNDHFGHPAGDRLLHEAGAAWTERMRGTDMLARWGGEEFCLLLPDCDEHCASAVLEDMRALTPEGQTFSAGVASWQPGTTAPQVVERADKALYAAKHQGRARTIVADVIVTA